MIEQSIAQESMRELEPVEVDAVCGGEGDYTFTECDSEPREIGEWTVVMYDIIDD